MSGFRNRSKSYLRDLSRAAAWMMRRNVGTNHWWRSKVLTTENSDKTRRPIFDTDTAQEIFDDLKERGLLVERSVDPDNSGVPAFTMKYDLGGWDKAVSDGRWLYGQGLKLKRTWMLILASLGLGIVITTAENRAVGILDGLLDKCVDAITPQSGDVGNDKMPVKCMDDQALDSPQHGERTEHDDEPERD